MIRVNQTLDHLCASPQVADAAVAIKALLERTGPSDIFALDVPATNPAGIRSLTDYVTSPRDAHEDVFLVHLAGHHPRLVDWLMRRPERVVAVCHTPETADLRLLRHRADAALAFSPAVARRLKRLGFSTVVATTLPVDPTALIRTPPAEHAVAGIEGPLVLAGGPVAPQRRVEHVLLTYHALVTYRRPDVSLVVAGPPGPPDYVRAIREMMAHLELTRARLCLDPTEGELAAYYRRSSTFLSASDQEGFGLDLRRAVAFGAPVVARRGPGMEHILNGAGLLVDATDPPSVMAAAIAAVLDREDLLEELASRSRQAQENVESRDRDCGFLRSLLAVL